MSLTIKLTQWKRKKRKDGTIPIYIRLTEHRRSRYLSTGIAVRPTHWNANKREVRRSHARHKALNSKLMELKHSVEDKRLKLERQDKLTIDTLKAEAKDDRYTSLLGCAERYHQSLEGTERFHEWKKFGVLLRNLNDFLGHKRRDVTDVDAELIEDFQRYLLETVGNNPNTVRRKLTSLKGLFNRLLKNKTIKHDPFTHVEKVQAQPVRKTRLTIEQIHTIQNLDLPAGSKLWHTRNYFLYSFYNAGIRFHDVCTLQWSNIVDGRLQYRMHKTGNHKNIKQIKPMNEILALYRPAKPSPTDLIFPILDQRYEDPAELRRKIGSQNALVNKRLKEIGRLAAIDETISFHVSRHSFTQWALKAGKGVNFLKLSLAHSSLKTTQQYINSFDEDLLDEGMQELYDEDH